MDQNTAEAFSHLRKESLDIYNRLKSIEEDIQFIYQIHNAYLDYPLLPNLRCGAWYTDPSLAAPHPAYFKSTDGHFSNWSFNLRRANLHLLNLCSSSDGIILVDSTRSGKRMPDALSKTIPIWCAVVNRAMLLRYPETSRRDWDILLHTPPGVVSTQEHSQIVPLLDGWASALNVRDHCFPCSCLTLKSFGSGIFLRLAKSIFTTSTSEYHFLNLLASASTDSNFKIWITPASTSFPKFPSESQTFFPVVCVSASRQVQEGVDRRSGGFVYIQGSGDDHELWGMGLTPEIFWEDRKLIMSTGRSDMEAVVASCASRAHGSNKARRPSAIDRVNGRILLCSTADIIAELKGQLHQTFEIPAVVTFLVLSSHARWNDASMVANPRVQYISAPEGKNGRTFVQTVFPRSMDFIQTQLIQGRSVCVACDTGKDLSVGVALAALSRFFDEHGKFLESNTQNNTLDKRIIRTRLEWIIASRPQANPTRSTLKRVNEFLLTPNSLFHKQT
ncbi:tRNA A64-2'-O-ribosylphosphate transferase [Lentinula raphanica]|nr:tRNA A64-2'-O-ribosylphosphate transferase [Lentinula raphanica]